jgi:triacylglycerol lipase
MNPLSELAIGCRRSVRGAALCCCVFAGLLGAPPSVDALSKPPFPVIFVHGVASGSGTWTSPRTLLNQQGWAFGGSPHLDPATLRVIGVSGGDFYTMDFSDNQHLHFSQQGWELAAIIQAVIQANPGTLKVIVVGHSMGGLAARTYLQGLARIPDTAFVSPYRQDVDRLIAIGTPHQGADLATFDSAVLAALGIDPLSQALEDLKPDSAAFSELNDLSAHPLPTTASYHSIIGVGTPVIGSFPAQDGDGVVTEASQDLGRLAGTAGLLHTSTRVSIQDRADCDPFLGNPLPNETHTCETSDSAVWTQILQHIASRGTAGLVAAVLPVSRSMQVGTPATAFATIINVGPDTGVACSIAPMTAVAASFLYQTTNPVTNELIGTPDTPVDIAAGGLQTFVMALTPTAPFPSTDIQLNFRCSNANPAAVTSGLNTLLLSASLTPVPDIVALAAASDGIVNIPGVNGTGVFAVATVNVGASGTIIASADTGSRNLPISISLCETEPTTGQCKSLMGSNVATLVDAGATPTFAVFVTGAGAVPFDPADNRIFVRFKDADGLTRGATSVAVRSQ